jgi:hypothetical protein
MRDSIEKRELEKHGITYDFFNEIHTHPNDTVGVEIFIQHCKDGLIRTYSERFKDFPHILEKSNNEKVEEIDLEMLSLIELAKRDEIESVKKKIKYILGLRQ